MKRIEELWLCLVPEPAYCRKAEAIITREGFPFGCSYLNHPTQGEEFGCPFATQGKVTLEWEEK